MFTLIDRAAYPFTVSFMIIPTSLARSRSRSRSRRSTARRIARVVLVLVARRGVCSPLRAPSASFRATCRCALGERDVPSRAREHARKEGSPLPARQASSGTEPVQGASPNRPPDLWERSGPRASHDTLRLLAGWLAACLAVHAGCRIHRAPRTPSLLSRGEQGDGSAGGEQSGI